MMKDDIQMDKSDDGDMTSFSRRDAEQVTKDDIQMSKSDDGDMTSPGRREAEQATLAQQEVTSEQHSFCSECGVQWLYNGYEVFFVHTIYISEQ
jgi:hypothetical protein